jgi:aryl-alcohol dehydrogenase-like predicted oxidoreductase
LQTDHIDVYWLHAPDDSTPMDETLRAMDDLIHAGKVRYIGCSNLPAWQVCEALWRSDVLQLNAFAAIQNQYSLLNRFEIEPDLVPLCRKHGLGIVTYSPLAIGLLSGAFRHGQPPAPGTPWADDARYREAFPQLMTPQADAVVHALIDIAAARGCTPAQAAMAWLLAQDAVTSVIIGPDSPAHVDEVTCAMSVTLTPDDLARLTTLSQPPARFRIA